MRIEIVSVAVETKTAANGRSYREAQILMKTNGKLTPKKLLDFGTPELVWNRIVEAQKGDMFDVEQTKNERGFYDWVDIFRVDEMEKEEMVKPAPAKAPADRFETADERAIRQVLIVRQSCLSVAANSLGVGASAEDIIARAKEFAEYVHS